jgi:hypothetical protein
MGFMFRFLLAGISSRPARHRTRDRVVVFGLHPQFDHDDFAAARLLHRLMQQGWDAACVVYGSDRERALGRLFEAERPH